MEFNAIEQNFCANRLEFTTCRFRKRKLDNSKLPEDFWTNIAKPAKIDFAIWVSEQEKFGVHLGCAITAATKVTLATRYRYRYNGHFLQTSF